MLDPVVTIDIIIRNFNRMRRVIFMSSVKRDFATSENFVIGNDMGKWGAGYRLIAAVWFIAIFILKPLYLEPVPPEEFWAFMGETAFWVGAIAAIYFVVFWAVKDIILAKLSPWAGTAIFLGIPAILGLMGLMPKEVSVAFGVYDNLSLLLAVRMRYAGCEVIALPTYIFKQRFTSYCAVNMFDMMERAVVTGRTVRNNHLLNMLSMAILLFVVGYFGFAQEVFMEAGMPLGIGQQWVYLLAIPALHLAYNAWQTFRTEGLYHKHTRWFGLGVVMLTFYMLLMNGIVPWSYSWHGLKLLGALYVLFEIGKLIRLKFVGAKN